MFLQSIFDSCFKRFINLFAMFDKQFGWFYFPVCRISFDKSFSADVLRF